MLIVIEMIYYNIYLLYHNADSVDDTTSEKEDAHHTSSCDTRCWQMIFHSVCFTEKKKEPAATTFRDYHGLTVAILI